MSPLLLASSYGHVAGLSCYVIHFNESNASLQSLGNFCKCDVSEPNSRLMRFSDAILQRGALVDNPSVPHRNFSNLPLGSGIVKSHRPGGTVHLPLSARAHQQAVSHSTGRVAPPPSIELPRDSPYAPKGSKVHHVEGLVLPSGRNCLLYCRHTIFSYAL
jgi:hypothetical protein